MLVNFDIDVGKLWLYFSKTLTLVLYFVSYRCSEESSHQEFKKHVGGACILFNPDLSTLIILVSLSKVDCNRCKPELAICRVFPITAHYKQTLY